MAKQFSESRKYEKFGSGMMAPIYATFERPLAAALRESGTPVTSKANSRLLDADHRFIGRDLQRSGLDYALWVGAGSESRYRFTDEKADTYFNSGNFAFEELMLDADGLHVKWTHNSRAGFITYVFPMSKDIYFIPLEPARAFIETNRHRFETASIANPTYITFCTLVPIEELLEAIPAIRHVHAHWYEDPAVPEWHKRKKFAKSRLPAQFKDRTMTLGEVKAYVTDVLPEKRKGGLPDMPITNLLRHMALKDKQRMINAGMYARHGLTALVQDILPMNRFELGAFTAEELLQASFQATPDEVATLEDGPDDEVDLA